MNDDTLAGGSDGQRLSPSASRFGHIPYPKISGKNKEFVRQLRLLKQKGCLPHQMVTIEGTVKLHGMHADIVYDLFDVVVARSTIRGAADLAHDASRLTISTDKSIDKKATTRTDVTITDSSRTAQGFLQTITFQSRNRICQPTELTHSYPSELTRHLRSLRQLRNQILIRHQTLHATTLLATTQPLLIAGEWIGSTVQPSIALCHLTPRFVILGIHLNGSWQQMSKYTDIEAADASIYSLFRVPVYHVEWDVRHLTEQNPALKVMQKFADEVAEQCPYARHFGVGIDIALQPPQQQQEEARSESSENSTRTAADNHVSATAAKTPEQPRTQSKTSQPRRENVSISVSVGGEGIVWTPAVTAAQTNPATWLKMKGAAFTSSTASSLPRLIERSIASFSNPVCTREVKGAEARSKPETDPSITTEHGQVEIDATTNVRAESDLKVEVTAAGHGQRSSLINHDSASLESPPQFLFRYVGNGTARTTAATADTDTNNTTAVELTDNSARNESNNSSFSPCHRLLTNKCRHWLTPHRQIQAFTYLTETRISPFHPNAVEKFAQWLVSDIMLEEADEIEAVIADMADGKPSHKKKGGEESHEQSRDDILSEMKIEVEREIRRVTKEMYLGFMREFS